VSLPPSLSPIKSSKTIGERVSRRRTRRRLLPTVRPSRPHRLRRNRRALRRDTFMTLYRTNILPRRPAQTCPSPRQRHDSSPFAYGPLGPRQSLASATIKTSESVAQRQCATNLKERNMKTYQISDVRLLVIKKNFVVIKQKD